MRISDWSSDVCSSDLKTIIRKKFSVDLETLKALIAQHDIVGLVVGLPLNMDGTDSPRTQSTRAFARNLLPLGLPLLLWAERWSTAAVERAMIAADVRRAQRATRVDSAAAACILRSEERRVGQAGVSTCRSLWSPSH